MSSKLEWIDGFVKNISEYVFVRERDSLLILMPNQAYKLNPTGLHILKQVLDGKSVAEVMGQWASDESAVEDVHNFFCDIRSLVMGCMGEGKDRKSVDTTPFTRPHNTYPVLSEIALTYRCNLKCSFCYAGCNCVRKPGKNEMSTQQVKKVLDRIRYEAEVPSVSWTGGEPTLRSDLPELTAYAAKNGMRVNLITNGTQLTTDLVSALKASGLRSAQVSLEGPTADIHDSITGVSGSFDKTTKGIALLKEADIHVHTNTTLNAQNLMHAESMLDKTAEMGLDRLSMNMAIPCGSALPKGVSIKYTDVAEVVENLRKSARQRNIQFLWYSPTPYCIYNPIAAGLGGKSCAACDGLLSVTPKGDVIPCSSLDKPVGNLLKDTFDKVWNSRKAKYWRDKEYACKTCKECEVFDLCTGACPIYFGAMGYDEIINARRSAKV